ncbi:MAG: hypothetical protein CSA34_07475 [Desulfobulbus propionicus]|nr:MAG: hypothetical protein CSA34_07475 [Desulfobulbus propionicus]
MENKKNKIIAALAALLIIGSIWGATGHRRATNMKAEVATLKTEQEQVSAQAVQAAETEAQLQKSLETKEGQLVKAKEELVGLRKATKGLEAALSERDARIQMLAEQIEVLQGKGQVDADRVAELQAKLDATAMEEAATREEMNNLVEADTQLQNALAENNKVIDQLEKEIAANLEQLASTREEFALLSGKMEAAQAQILGLEKIVEEKEALLEETNDELDKVKTNTDVLLGEITDQQDALQEMSVENGELVKSLADKNEEIAALQEQLMQTPVQPTQQ